MTTPPFLADLVPLKWKTAVAALSAVLTIAVPYLLQLVVYLPDPWPIVVAGVIAVLGVVGVYHAPYVPEKAVIAPDTAEVTAAAMLPEGGYQAPWRRPRDA